MTELDFNCIGSYSANELFAFVKYGGLASAYEVIFVRKVPGGSVEIEQVSREPRRIRLKVSGSVPQIIPCHELGTALACIRDGLDLGGANG